MRGACRPDANYGFWRMPLYDVAASLDSVKLAFIAAELQGLQVIAADISRGYIQAKTKEMVYTIAEPEFGKYVGHTLLVDKALYGLQTSGNAWHEQIADNLRSMGFNISK